MSRAQGIRGIFASQTCMPRITAKLWRNLEAHGLCCEEIREPMKLYGCKSLRIALSAIGHQQ